MTVRKNAILSTLRNKCRGEIIAQGRDDAALKLLLQMELPAVELTPLREMLATMAGRRELVITMNGKRFEQIALPESATTVQALDHQGDGTVPTPRGQTKTTYPRTAEGRPLPRRLPDDLVGPVSVRYRDLSTGESESAATTTTVDSQTREAIETAASLVMEELRRLPSTRLGQDEVMATIRGVLLTLYSEVPELASTFVARVFDYLVKNRHLFREQGQGAEAVTYNFTRLSDELSGPTTVDEDTSPQWLATLTKLAEVAERLSQERDRAREELSQLRETHVSTDVLEQLTAKLEAATKKRGELEGQVEQLEGRLARAATNLRTAKQEHDRELNRIRTTHQSQLGQLREQLRGAQEQAQQRPASNGHSAVSPDLLARISRLGVNVGEKSA